MSSTYPDIPALRVRALNDRPVRPEGGYVVYWCIANRRTGWNFSLQRAAWYAAHLGRPLLVLNALRVGYRWASDRLHTFLLQSIGEMDARLVELRAQGLGGVVHYPYVEEHPEAGKGLLAALARDACVVVSDDFPAFMMPRMLEAAARQLEVRLEAVDSNGLLPMRATSRVFGRAVDFRRYLHDNLLLHLDQMPLACPLSALPPLPQVDENLLAPLTARWPRASAAWLGAEKKLLATLPIDHAVPMVESTPGGEPHGRRRWQSFLNHKLERYALERNDPDSRAASGLSPYLHFGNLSAHEVFEDLRRREDWHVERVNRKHRASREGFWGMSPEVESFLDEFVTWRELGYNMCAHSPHDYDRYASLPAWARQTLEDHARDARPYTYTLEQFEEGRTHDPLWNAAQRELREEGIIHNYLRMLWGKKILHWTASPQEALAVMVELNNKYALDGRNPNSYSGIFWVLGRYDRAWGPEREVFGKIRYMTSESTMNKLRLKHYLARYGGRAL